MAADTDRDRTGLLPTATGASTSQLAARPAAPLRRLVNRYTWHRFEGFPSGVHQGLPSRHVTVMLSLEDPFDIVAMPGAQAPASFRSFAGGLHTAPASVAHDGRGCGIGIELTALGARRLLGMPASGLAAIVVDLRDLWGTAVDELEERLLCKPTWLRRVAVLDAILARLASDGADIAPEIAHAWHELSASAGAARIGSVADDVGWSRQHLTARFRGEFGLSPKQAARIMRFERAASLLSSGRRLADVAAAAGSSTSRTSTRSGARSRA